jgi:peptidoglycan/LPS O-acetylase OafA/YrhL
LTDSTVAAAPRGGHLLPLDGVRGLAILIVIIHNSAWIGGESRSFLMKLTTAITATGWLGVSLFFTLSGFLITGILLDTKHKPAYFQSFYLRRTLRIFPLYYAVIAFTVFVAPLIAWSPHWIDSVFRTQWLYWLYITNWFLPFGSLIWGLSTFWSLAVEEQFYLLWPLVVRYVTSRRLLFLCLGVIVATPFIRLALRMAGLPADVNYFWTITRWDALFAGALVAILLRDVAWRESLRWWQGRVAAVAGAALIVLVGLQHGFHSDGLGTQVIGQSLIAILSACLIAYAVEEGPSAKRRLQAFLSFGALRTLGKYSYAMYIFHFPIHMLLTPYAEAWVQGADTPARFARVALYVSTVLGLSFLAALVSWRLIEKPFLDLKDKIAPRPA